MSDILFRRLRYFLSPQWDIYKNIALRTGGQSVIDIGFGTGFGTLQFLEYTKRVDAIETDGHAVGFARDSFPGVFWHHASITDFGWSIGAQWDIAVMIEVLEHIEDYSRALQGVRSILKEGGKFYITARNAKSDLRLNELHQREWTPKQFKEALSEFFTNVTLLDYTLTHEQAEDTKLTPLIAICQKGD